MPKHAGPLGLALLAFALVAFILHAAPDPPAVTGFPPDAAQAETSAEGHYQSLVSTDQIQQFHRYLTAEPHPAASARNDELARWVANQWKQQGLEDVTIHEYDVLNSTPRSVSLEMVAPTRYRALLREEPYDIDPDTKNPNISPAFLGYSASGEATAAVVYAHNGDPEDYAYLKRHGIRVRGKIVLVRYSNPYSYRGFKAYTAQKEGAAGILIYSDPAEDGYRQGAPYPYGPWGSETHIQRGAITYDFLEPGDPLTPGWAALPGAKRIPISQAITLPKIMALPLSWHDAKPLLERLDGPEAPLTWQGGLPLRYRLGGKRVIVHMKVDMDTRIEPYYVPEARITGSEFPDQWVIVGNHRDAWVFGAVDPSSGTASMMEMTRDLGQMLKQGIRPRRTIVFGSWDGEEYALTGSTEWAEQFSTELKQKAVAYLNVDSAVSGPEFHGTTVASLAPMLVDVSRTVAAPRGKTLYQDWQETRQRELAEGRGISDSDLPDLQIGSGSDHTVFLNILGIPVMNLEFDGPYGVYHSAYDDYYWMNHFGDPGYLYHALMTKLWGSLAMRLANAEIIPYDFHAYARAIRRFTNDMSDRTYASGHMDLAGLFLRIANLKRRAAISN